MLERASLLATVPKPDSTETLLVLRAQAGDLAAFESLYKLYGPRLTQHLRNVTRDEDLAQDVLQNTFILMYRKIRWIREPASLSPWLYRVATREAIRALRVRRRRGESQVFDDSPDPSTGPTEDTLGRALLAREAREEVLRLPDLSRAVLSMHYLEGLPIADVAALLDVPIGTAKSRLAAGLNRLRRVLLGPRGVAV